MNLRILILFYDSVVASIWKYCILCWGGNVTGIDARRINRVVKGAVRVIGVQQQSMEETYTSLLAGKLNDIMDDISHPLHERLAGQLIVRSGRMRLPSAVTDRYLSSFVPQAIKLHNSHHQRSNFIIEL